LIVNESDKSYVDRKLFKITNIVVDLISKDLPQTVSNTKMKFAGIWTDGYPNNYVSGRLYNVLNIGTSLRLSQFNFGVRDLLDEKIFYLNMSPYVPNRLVATEQEINNTFGVFFPTTQSKDYLYLRGDAFENYSFNNLQTTNNKMELTAVIEALKMYSQNINFHIFSDSLYVINCAQGKWKRKANLDFWGEYDKVSRGKNIIFEWVKGHNGDKYNEMVDKLAKKGAE
jgi:ribonuclease HI